MRIHPYATFWQGPPFYRHDEGLAAAIRRHGNELDTRSQERTDWELLASHLEAIQGLAVTVG